MVKKNLLIESLNLLASSSKDQKKYLINLFGDTYFNLDEILLEYEDSKFLHDKYNDFIKKEFLELEILINEIEKYELLEIEDLDNLLWNKVRKKSQEIIEIINNR